MFQVPWQLLGRVMSHADIPLGLHEDGNLGGDTLTHRGPSQEQSHSETLRNKSIGCYEITCKM